MFYCPGCDKHHGIMVGQGAGPRWGYNEDPQKPTFTPSILVRYVQPTPEGERMMKAMEPLPSGMARYPSTDEVCHSFITDGQIQFLGDCTHALAGQTLPLPKLPGAEVAP
jgi:hypothetical protein